MFLGFPKEITNFLADIEKNNNKEWFEQHKHIYHDSILEPSRAFVVEMGEHLQALVPTIKAIPKVNGSLFRIYRDVRFSKNKLPIKSRIGVIFWQGVGKRMQSSSFYLHFDKESIFFASGIRNFDDESLKKYREFIKDEKNRQKLHDVLEEMKQRGFLVPEPKYKRVPREFDKDMSFVYLSLFANMFVYKEMPLPKEFFTKEFPEFAYEIYEQMWDMQKVVYEIASLPPQNQKQS